jgi:hypothetical protein
MIGSPIFYDGFSLYIQEGTTMKKSTAEFENRIAHAKNIDELRSILTELPKLDFRGKFTELTIKYDISFSKVQIASGIVKSTFYAFFSPDDGIKRKPKKHHIIKMGLAMHVTLEELNELLKLAQHKELYAKNKDDAIIIYGLKNKLSVMQIEELLVDAQASLSLLDK